MSPTLGKPIGMGYVPAEAATEGQPIAIEIRGRPVPGRIVRLPFYQHRTKSTGRRATRRG
jgi:aminomethyltransferase